MAVKKYNARTRSLTIQFDAGEAFIATKLVGEETLSDSSFFIVDFACEQALNDKLLGKEVAVNYIQNEEERNFHGLLTSINLIGYSQEKELYFYQIKADDPLSLLSYRQNRQLFQKVNSKQIISSILNDIGFSKYVQFKLSSTGSLHDYFCQMDETDLAFIQRIMSIEGWHYRLDHSKDGPIVIISDSNQSFSKINKSTLTYQMASNTQGRKLNQWTQHQQLGFNKLSFADHSQEQSEVFESGERKSIHQYGSNTFRQYQYGQGAEDKNQLRNLVKFQMEALDVEKNMASSLSSLIELASGTKFTLTKHPITELNQEYVIYKISHHIDTNNRQTNYQNTFSCFPNNSIFRPRLLTKPKVNSIHSATVVGPDGEEIYKDKQGRIKVQFHWDRNGKQNENSSCWIAVSNLMSSKGYGMYFVPRIGDEVLIQYIDGDPDKPVIIGSLYNNANKPPYSSSSQSGIKTRSTPKGNNQQGNELRFEDQKDKEHIYLLAQKDLLIDVNNDSVTKITGNLHQSVEKMTELNSKENFNITGEKEFSLKTKENTQINADKDIELSASNQNINAKSSIKIDGQSISITGQSKIELCVGACKIEISPSGIILDAPQISINGKAKAEMKAAMVSVEGQGKTEIKGTLLSIQGSAMTEVKAGAMVQIQGAITKIN